MNIDFKPFLQARFLRPPSANEMYTTIPWTRADGVRSTRRVKTKKLISFQKDAASQIKQAEIYNHEAIKYIRACKRKKIFLPLKLEIVFYLPTEWKIDGDNLLKALQDVIFKHLDLNDTLVTDWNIKKRVNREDPHCRVRLSFANFEEDEQW